MFAKLHRSAPLLLVALLAAATVWAVDSKPSAPSPDDYRKEIEAWRKERADSLKEEDGWLTLVGLYWLKPGENRFGSDPASPVILPQGKAPAMAGVLVQEGNAVTIRVEPGVAITADGKEVKPGMTLKTDAEGEPTVLELGSLKFYLIRRGDRLGVRIKDRQSPTLASFKGLDNYPIQPAWRVVARFEPYKDKKIPIANIVGQVQEIPSPGAVIFDWHGKTYRLDALQGSPEGGLFVLFGDKTNGKETYGAGRFLDTDPPKDGKVVVDFNTAYNPPCAFTAFATCPLPPPQNKLSIAVEAGEKKFAGGPHS
ncbi:MAG TPA: DUF1684 domain-containing protein [Thermoanaerobaculia bacterium]|jgi:hypothetical protein|nr:DUF1684 domain-containing protein [Thermoanaerobaculia bacterium]